MLRRLWSAQTGIFLAIWLSLMFVGRSELFRDPGTFWHTAAGEQMLQSGRVIRADAFSFTFRGKPWVDSQWLANCGMAAVHRAAGWDGLLLATVTLLAAIYTWAAWRWIRAGLHTLPALLVLGWVLAASSHQFHVRPLVLTMGLLGWTFSLLVDAEAGRQPVRRLWWLVPVFVLWANLHGGVVGGLGTVGIVAAGWCLAGPLGQESPVRCLRDAAVLAALLLSLTLSVLVNPYGFDLPRTWFRILALPLPETIQEHAPLDLSRPYAWAIVLLGAGYAFALAGVFPKRPRVTWLLPLVWFVLACQRVRNAPLFAITAMIAGADLLPYTRWTTWLARRGMFSFPVRGQPAASTARNYHSAAVPCAVVAVTLVLQLAGVTVPIVGCGWVKLDAMRWPVDLLPQLRAIPRENPDSARLFNDMLYGGFLIFHAPQLQVFIDDRCELYGREFLQAYDHARREEPSQLDAWSKQYRFRYALVETGSLLDGYLRGSDTWTTTGRSGAATLYRRQAVGDGP